MKKTVDASFELLVGRSESQLVRCWSDHLVHRECLSALEILRDEAANAGFELAIASSYRSYDRQLLIWQEKVAGKRPVLDAAEHPLVVSELDDEELLWALLRWSALPGTSRHHWGTDLDVYDARALREAGSKLQLTVAECAPDGPLGDFHQWLSESIATGRSQGFYRPYDCDRGGVAEEPWHLSYAPVARELQAAFDYGLFQRLQNEGLWPLGGAIGRHSEQIFTRFIESNHI